MLHYRAKPFALRHSLHPTNNFLNKFDSRLPYHFLQNTDHLDSSFTVSQRFPFCDITKAMLLAGPYHTCLFCILLLTYPVSNWLGIEANGKHCCLKVSDDNFHISQAIVLQPCPLVQQCTRQPNRNDRQGPRWHIPQQIGRPRSSAQNTSATFECYNVLIDLISMLIRWNHSITNIFRIKLSRDFVLVSIPTLSTVRISNKIVKYSHRPPQIENQNGRHIHVYDEAICKIDITFQLFKIETLFKCPSPYFQLQ